MSCDEGATCRLPLALGRPEAWAGLSHGSGARGTSREWGSQTSLASGVWTLRGTGRQEIPLHLPVSKATFCLPWKTEPGEVPGSSCFWLPDTQVALYTPYFT